EAMSIAGPAVTTCANVKLPECGDHAPQHVDLILKCGTEANENQGTTLGGLERRWPRFGPRGIVKLWTRVHQLFRRIGRREVERDACEEDATRAASADRRDAQADPAPAPAVF